MLKNIGLCLVCFLAFSCQSKEEKILSDAINAHGGREFEKLDVNFNFRGIEYRLMRNQGEYEYHRIQTDTLKNSTLDVLKNDSFRRLINEQEVSVLDSMAAKYSNSINAVAYFFLLPFGLQNPAVNKLYEKDIVIKGKNYHQIKVWFEKEGGGVDHQDEYKFWFNSKTKRLDYLAYSYESDGGGVRFREAINGKRVSSFYFQDYNNFGYEDQNYPLDDLRIDFENGKLTFLSKIENENITLKE
jgi:hypothetical protein